jgi:hypothetical protein
VKKAPNQRFFGLFLISFFFFFFLFFRADRILQGQNEGVKKKVFEFWLFWPVFEEEFWFLVFDG